MSGDEYLRFTAEKLENLKLEEVRQLKNSDYISGISGIIRLLIIMKETLGNSYVSDNTIEKFAKVLLERIETNNEKVLETVGIAHGISGVMLGLVSGGLVNPNMVKEMLLKETQLKLPEENKYKWCWGLSGMIQARIAILGMDSECIDESQLDDLIGQYEKVLTKVINDDSLCHGNGSIITTLKMIYQYTKDKKWLLLLQVWISNVNMNSLFEGYKIPKVADIMAKGMFDGIFGIAWLYLYISDSINNLLLLEAK